MENIKLIKEVEKLRKKTYSDSLINKLTRQNYQIDLKEMYKPLLIGQEAQLEESKKTTT